MDNLKRDDPQGVNEDPLVRAQVELVEENKNVEGYEPDCDDWGPFRRYVVFER